LQKAKDELPAQVTVDPETRRRVDEMFSQANKATTREGADNFWDAASSRATPNKNPGGDALSFDQASELGLAPGENKPS
jgi:hypothetical protein